jgi:hypothetical protein
MLAATFRLWQGRMHFTVTITIVLPGNRLRGSAAPLLEASDDGEDVLDVTDHVFAPSVRVRQAHNREALGG